MSQNEPRKRILTRIVTGKLHLGHFVGSHRHHSPCKRSTSASSWWLTCILT